MTFFLNKWNTASFDKLHMLALYTVVRQRD